MVLLGLQIAMASSAFSTIGAMMRFDVNYVGRAFTGSDLGDTVRATIVLLLALSVVASLLTSPFGLKSPLPPPRANTT